MENRYGWVMVAVGAIITCLAMGAIFALPVYLEPMDDTGWSRAGISAAMTLGFVVMGIAGFGWGTLSDRIGARPVVLMAAVILAAGLVIASRATNLLVFQLAYGVLACGAVGAFFAPLIAATVGWFDQHRSLAVSLVSIGGGVAPMIMTPVASVLITAYGWRSAMLIIAIGISVVIFPLALLIRNAPREGAALAGGAAAPNTSTAPRSSAWAALRTPQFIILATTFFFCCAAHSGPIFHTVSYAELCGASSLAAASIYSVEGVAGLFGRVLFGTLADRIGVKRVIVAGLLIQAIGIYSYIFVTQLSDFYERSLVLGMVYGGVMPLYAILAREYFSQGVMGTVLGAATMMSSIGMAFGPVGGGWLFDHFGSYYWLYVASAGIGVAATLMALTFPPIKRRTGSGPELAAA
jgi:MFS family permease